MADEKKKNLKKQNLSTLTIDQLLTSEANRIDVIDELIDRSEGFSLEARGNIKRFLVSIEQDLRHNCFNLGNCYHDGLLPNQEKAAEFLRLAADRGDADSQNTLGVYFWYGYGVEKDVKTAVRYFRMSALQGHPDGQSNLGYCYQHGKGVEQNGEKAVSHFTLAAGKGNANAQNGLGECRLFGIEEIVTRNVKSAVGLFRDSAKQGNAKAQSNLGYCYKYGFGVDRNVEEAVRLFCEGTVQGNASAQTNLGECYLYGHGVKKDEREAARLFHLAVERDHAGAQAYLGHCYQYGLGVGKNMKKALRLYRLGVKQENAFAQNALGVCYLNGQGVQKDMAEALRLFRLGSLENTKAQTNLGLCYFHGWGGEKNMTEAVLLYRLAAQRGNATAQNNLGSCYLYGHGVENDVTEAVRLFRLAAKQGLQQAIKSLDFCFSRGIAEAYPEPANEASEDETDLTVVWPEKAMQDSPIAIETDKKSMERCHLAAKHGDAGAQINLGLCYWYGCGVKKNVEQAERYFRLSAEQGHATGQYNLAVYYEINKGMGEEVMRLYDLAAAQGHARARVALGLHLYAQERDVEAVRLFRLALVQGQGLGQTFLAVAQNGLGQCYLRGYGVKRNVIKAVELFYSSANKGNHQAQTHLGEYYLDKNVDEAIRLFGLAAVQGNTKAQSNLSSLNRKLKISSWSKRIVGYFFTSSVTESKIIDVKKTPSPVQTGDNKYSPGKSLPIQSSSEDLARDIISPSSISVDSKEKLDKKTTEVADAKTPLLSSAERNNLDTIDEEELEEDTKKNPTFGR